jgi:hypothetical protein
MDDAPPVRHVLPSLVFAAGAVGLTMMLLPDELARDLALGEFRTAHRHWIGPVAVSSCALWIGYILTSWIGPRRVLRLRVPSQSKTSPLSSFDRSPAEQALLGYVLSSGARDLLVSPKVKAVDALLRKGLLELPAGTDAVDPCRCRVPEWAVTALQPHSTRLIRAAENVDLRTAKDLEAFQRRPASWLARTPA